MDELNKTAERNTELEARIGFMLSSRQAYEEEVAKAEEKSDDGEDSDEDDADKDASFDDDKDKGKTVKMLQPSFVALNRHITQICLSSS